MALADDRLARLDAEDLDAWDHEVAMSGQRSGGRVVITACIVLYVRRRLGATRHRRRP
jgi:hypothetical protein